MPLLTSTPHFPTSLRPHTWLQVLYAARDWKGLQEYVVLLSKRRSQLKQAVQAMVRQCMGYIADTPDKASC